MSKLVLPEQILHTPIPDQARAKELRGLGYDDIPADTKHPLYDSPLVQLSKYGIQSRSYYSRKNSTGDPVSGVSPDVLVRKGTAERLARVSEFIAGADWIKRFCGGEVDIRVDEGLRSLALQRYVSQVRYPEFLRQKLEREPGETDEIFETRVQEIVAKRVSKAKQPPHSTGGVVDLRIIRLDGENETVSYGYNHKDPPTIETDYFERNSKAPNAERFAQVRRLVHWTMDAVGGVVNPMEPWHYGFVDRQDSRYASDGLTARVASRPMTFYGPVPGMPDGAPELVAALQQADQN